MKYVLMVSHGSLAEGMKSVLEMLLGKRPYVMACCMEQGISADAFANKLEELLAPLSPNDRVIVLGDIVGGSPFTTALNCLTEKGLLEHALAFGGMNLTMAIAALMGVEDNLSDDELKQNILKGSQEAVREVPLFGASSDKEEI